MDYSSTSVAFIARSERLVKTYFLAIRKNGPGALAISAVALGFVLFLRVLGIAGLVTLVRRREWRVFLVIVAAAAYFNFVYPFYGNSRFRIGVDPLLILLALYGFSGLREARRRRRAGAATKV